MGRSRRRYRWLVVIGFLLAVLVGGLYTVARVSFEGEPAGTKLASQLNKIMRGRIEIGSIVWPADAIKTLMTGGWIPVELHDVKVWDDCALSAVAVGDPDELRTGDPNEDCMPDDHPDPEGKRRPRRLLVSTPLITADIDPHALLGFNFSFRNVYIHGGEALIEQTLEPYPLHAYDRQIVSIVTAFYPRMTAGFRAGIYADQPPPVFDLRDIHTDHLNLTIHVGPVAADEPTKDAKVGFAVTARIEDLAIDPAEDPAQQTHDSFLYMNAIDPLVFKFYVRLKALAKRGTMRVWDFGPRAAFHIPAEGEKFGAGRDEPMYEINATDIDLNRLAQLPTEWARKDYVANTLELEGSFRTIPCVDTDHGNKPPDPKDGALLTVSGQILDYWDRAYDGSWDLTFAGKNLAPTVHTCIKDNVRADNPNTEGTITLTGPFVTLPKVGLDLKNVDIDIPIAPKEEPVHLTLAEVHGAVDLVNETGTIDKTRALIQGGKEPGEIDLAAVFSTTTRFVSATVDIVKPVDATRFLPPALLAATGGQVWGHVHTSGDLDEGFALDDFDLSLGVSRADRRVHVHSGRIFTNDRFDTAKLENVAIAAGLSTIVVNGTVDQAHHKFGKVSIDGEFPDLNVWLKRLGYPAFAASAGGGHIVIDGDMSNPTVDIDTTLGGVPCIDKLVFHGRVHDNTLDIHRMTTSKFGGELTGSATIKLGDTPVIDKLHFAGNKLLVPRLCGLDKLGATGTLDKLELDLHGAVDKNRKPIDWLDYAQVYLSAPKLSVSGESFSNVSLCLNRKDDGDKCRTRNAHLDDDDLQECEAGKKGGFCAVVTAGRDAGGRFDATVAKLPPARGQRGARLGGTIALEDIPLTVLEPIIGKDKLGGMASATLHLSGSPEAPQATGAIELLRGFAMGAFLGDTQLAVEPATTENGQPGVSVKGSALAGRLAIAATLGTALPYALDAKVTVHRLEVDPFVDLAKVTGLDDPLTAWASGTIALKTELAPKSGKAAPDAWVELTELEATLQHRAADGRLTPLTLSARPQKDRPAVSLHVTPDLLEVACRDGRTPCNTVLATPVGDIEVAGHATTSEVTLRASGTLDVGRLAVLFDTVVDDLRGKAAFFAQVSGTIKQPKVEVSLDLEPKDARDMIQLRPVGTDTVVRIPGGLVKYANGALGFNAVTVDVVEDENVNEHNQLVLHGALQLDGLKPSAWGLYVEGRIAGRLLTLVAPAKIAQASGAVTIGPPSCASDDPNEAAPETCGALTLTGKGPLPLIDGTLSFGGRDGLRIIPRAGLRRELTFDRGSIDIRTDVTPDEHRTYTIDIGDVYGEGFGATMSIDQGEVSRIEGQIQLVDGAPSAHVTLDASNIPMRIPGTLDLTLSAERIRFDYRDGHLSVGCASGRPNENCGEIKLVNGLFTRSYELTDAVKPTPSTTATTPFWEDPANAWLRDADLDLQIDVQKFSVKNNIADPIDLHGQSLRLTNNPADPRLSGTISVDRGTFRIPATRANFTRTTGTVTFSSTESIANPRIEVTSDADYRDLTGQDHVVTLTITGPLANLSWDLKTSTGYNKSQTLALLVLGRNPEQLRRSLGDQAIGQDPTRVDPTTNPSASAADQLVKDLAGDWVSGLVGSSLTRLTRIDVLRFELGFGAIGIQAEKRFFENFSLVGEAEITTRGNTENFRGVVRTPWRLLLPTSSIELQGSYLRKDFLDPAELDITDGQARLVWKLFVP